MCPAATAVVRVRLRIDAGRSAGRRRAPGAGNGARRAVACRRAVTGRRRWARRTADVTTRAAVLWTGVLTRSRAIHLARGAFALAVLASHASRARRRAIAAVRRVARRVDAARSAERRLWRRATSDARVTIARTGTPWLRGRTHRCAASAVARLGDVRFAPVICVGRAMHPSCRAGGRRDRAHAGVACGRARDVLQCGAIVTASAAVLRIVRRVGAHSAADVGHDGGAPRRCVGRRRRCVIDGRIRCASGFCCRGLVVF